MWQEKEICIGEVKKLLDDGYEIEVDSPDGYVPVNFFVDKGLWKEYVLHMDDPDFTPVRCNEKHLFETSLGWLDAEVLCGKGEVNILTKKGYVKGHVTSTDEMIPIVDINVNHENHRYYTNGVSSHNTGVGKSLFMCHVGAAALTQGKNVLYITMEMAEERIAERIDANLMNLPIDQLDKIDKSTFDNKIESIAKKTIGKLIIKEYPTGSAHTGHFRALLKELKLKKSFEPDIIFIDYLNICSSSRMKLGGSTNTYSLIKSIAEEIRGLAVEFDVPIMSATQTTRSGYCLDPYTKVQSKNGPKDLKDVVLGDELLSNNGWNKVKTIFPPQYKKTYCITTKSGKKIYCSRDHLFPVEDGSEKSINKGLNVGDKLIIK